MTELFVTGLCASFILADGFTKSVGAWLLAKGVPDMWMPAAAGSLFLLPLFLFVWMLSLIPPPSNDDVIDRSERQPMTGAERMALIRRHGIGLLCLLAAYLLITVLRSIRADFAKEIWAGLGYEGKPAIFTQSEFWVGLGVSVVVGAIVFIRRNKTAFFTGLWMCLGGLLVGAAALWAHQAGLLDGFWFMVLLGFGMYVPYVAVHTTIFERLIALTREKANIGFLMTMADATGYLGYCVLMLGKSALPKGDTFLPFFTTATWSILGGAAACLIACQIFYRRRATADAIRVGEPESNGRMTAAAEI